MPKAEEKAAATPPEAPRGTGTYGPLPKALPAPSTGKRGTPPFRVSYRVALREITEVVTGLLKDTGEQWNDQAKQDLVSTAFISAAKTGAVLFDFQEDA